LLCDDRPEPVVDVGVGELPWTTLELLAALRDAGSNAEVLGVDVDEGALEAARAMAVPGVRFERSGFDLPVRARVVRAMNVLRGLRAHEVAGAHARMGAELVEGGVLLEGSSNAEGDALTALWIRRRGAQLEREALVMHVAGTRGYAPNAAFGPLPCDLRRRWKGTSLEDLRGDWEAAFAEIRRKGVPALALAAETSERLAGRRSDVPLVPTLWAKGTLVWRPPDGVPVGR
jgi:hypothetical protein